MNSETIFPYLGVRYQIEYHSCKLDCLYCVADWKDRFLAMIFDQLVVTPMKEMTKLLSFLDLVLKQMTLDRRSCHF